MLLIVLIIIATVGVTLALVIAIKSHNDEIAGYYDAARNILKEDRLDKTLKNRCDSDDAENYDGRTKPMVYIKIKGKKNEKYVFDLCNGVCIGRDRNQNQVCINEAVVSSTHCRIFTASDGIYIQDMNSLNGVVVKYGIFSSVLIASGQCSKLSYKNTVIIGTTKLKVVVFYFDLMMM